MADLMRRCIMHDDVSMHQALHAGANNYGMHEKTREIIRTLMAEHGIRSERQLALSCGMDQSTLHRFLSEKTDTLSFAHIQALAQYFEVTVSQLIGELPLEEDQKIRTVMKVMESLPEYKKYVIVATSQTLATTGNGP